MNIELNEVERALVKKTMESYLSELRLEIRETKGDKSTLHKEEELLKGLIQKVS